MMVAPLGPCGGIGIRTPVIIHQVAIRPCANLTICSWASTTGNWQGPTAAVLLLIYRWATKQRARYGGFRREGESACSVGVLWWAGTESNCRHKDFQSKNS